MGFLAISFTILKVNTYVHNSNFWCNFQLDIYIGAVIVVYYILNLAINLFTLIIIIIKQLLWNEYIIVVLINSRALLLYTYLPDAKQVSSILSSRSLFLTLCVSVYSTLHKSDKNESLYSPPKCRQNVIFFSFQRVKLVLIPFLGTWYLNNFLSF